MCHFANVGYNHRFRINILNLVYHVYLLLKYIELFKAVVLMDGLG